LPRYDYLPRKVKKESRTPPEPRLRVQPLDISEQFLLELYVESRTIVADAIHRIAIRVGGCVPS